MQQKDTLIAPCGMNCALCLAYQRTKNHCPGCNIYSKDKAKSCQNCTIKNCENLKKSESGFCSSCSKFPCERLKHLDKRYRTKYRMSMLNNLKDINEQGLATFIEMENEKWQCPKCHLLLCVHRIECQNCLKIQNAQGIKKEK